MIKGFEDAFTDLQSEFVSLLLLATQNPKNAKMRNNSELA